MDAARRDEFERWRYWACLLLLGLLAIPVPAFASVVDLGVTGQPGDTPWWAAEIVPGRNGDGVVTITNTGSDDCSVLVWVGNITGERALGQYMLYSVSGPRLVTSMTFPATIYDFPQAPDPSRSIVVSPVSPGETVSLDWTWEFRETGVPQNEAQGKQIGFNVYYTLISPPVERNGWYTVTPPVFRQVPIPGEPCTAMNQTLQEYRVYTCTAELCSYVVTGQRWLDLGLVLHDEDGDGICDGDETPTPTPLSTVTRTVPATTVVSATNTTPAPTVDTSLCPPPAVPTGPATVITGPTVITAPGYYVLGTGAVDTAAPIFIEVRSSGVTVDGMGRTIDGIDGDGSYGIRVRGDGPLEKVVVQNVTVNDFAYGIALVDTSQSLINRVGATSNTYDGIMVLGGGDNEIACSLVLRDDDGINMTATTGTRVMGNTVTGNIRGSGVHVGPGSSWIAVVGNIVAENDEGIEVENARGVAIRSNRIFGSRYRGMNLTAADEMTVVDNYFSNRENVRRHAGAFTGVWSQAPAAGPNVMGNPSIGGNFWGTPDGTGFSEVTPDLDGDGFADGTYVLPDGLGTDLYPLGPSLSFSWTVATTRAPSTAGRLVTGADVDGPGARAGDEQAIAAGGAPPGSADLTGAGTQPVAAFATPTAAGAGWGAGTAAGLPALPAPAFLMIAGPAALLVAGLILLRRRR
jgi:parallel beta-helix repeat protein